MKLDIYKRSTLKEKISHRLKTMSSNYVLNELRKIRRYYKENALENCHEDLRPMINGLFSQVYDIYMFNSEKTSEAMKPSKEAAKRYCLLSLAHMSSKLSRNSKDYPQEVVMELREFLNDLGHKAEEIQDISVAPMEPFVDCVKSVFNADMIITEDNYNRLDYVKRTRELVEECFEHPERLGLQDVDERLYKNREIEPGDIRRGDIDTEFNNFLKKISGNMFGVDSPGVNKTALNLLNLINGKEEQDRKEIEDFNRKYPLELEDGTKTEFDPLDPNNFKGIRR